MSFSPLAPAGFTATKTVYHYSRQQKNLPLMRALSVQEGIKMPREETNNHSTNNVFTSILLKIIFLLQVNADLVPLFCS